jgi:hypothetical protein
MIGYRKTDRRALQGIAEPQVAHVDAVAVPGSVD